MRYPLRRVKRGARTEQGAVAIMVAACILGLLIVAAMVLDFGLARLDRQINKSAADDAVAAGIQGFDEGGDGSVYPYKGVCDALEFLKTNVSALSSLSYSACTTANFALTCDPSNPGNTPANFTGTVGGYRVKIQAPYTLPDANFPEDNAMTSLKNDNDQPCNQLAVIIEQRRKPGLGSLAGRGDLLTVIRSVGRVAVGPGDLAPALLLLDRTHCQVLALASGGAGSDSHIRVYGSAVYVAKRVDGTPGLLETPGSIHADSNASACGGGSPAPPVILGKSTDGIVAFGSPDSTVSGTITSVASKNGLPASTVYDSASNAYGTTAKDELSTGVKTPPGGHKTVTRKVVDDRYLGLAASTGVAGAIADAERDVFSASTGVTVGNAALKGYKVVTNCNPTATELSAAGVTSLTKVYINCSSPTGFKGTAPILGPEVIFNGQIASSALVSLPNAKKVYVFGNGAGIDASNGFSMHTAGRTDALGTCLNTISPDKATLFVKDGGINASGGLLRLCNTTVFLMGGRPNGCLSSVQYVIDPVVKPCGGAAGTGLIKIGGTATQDWTAPNKWDDMTMLTEAEKKAEWYDKTGPEDLALWSETYGSGPDWQMAGGGSMHLVGVFMTPNAAPFVVKGGAAQQLSNAQYVAASFQLTGGATLKMTVDANNVISFPALTPFTLVR